MVNTSGHSSFAIVTVSDHWIYSWFDLLRILRNHDCHRIALSVNWKVFYTPKLLYTLAMLLLLLLLFFNYALRPFKAYRAIWVRCSNFRHQASPPESTQRWKVELWVRNVR